ncbi:putative FMN-dependent luciferase-like monooxygenase, KPN_01858 family [Serratia quinivorans]|uniref:Putative FMN-dependent luciferase-like monooxygenase, KPN_01858 family n=1 Tax=Serratia quinivorans TaxID=137545 RepID=A0A380AL26_9GAMM|nr:putative FMN-dependent luciferase-like monooxygenase, KPN_01858 family [Serratia quinivorans]
MSSKRLGFFTRLLDQGSAQQRYRLATEQILHAERAGFDSAWVAQHHFHEDEGGLPSPLVFLAQVAARTRHIRLGTGGDHAADGVGHSGGGGYRGVGSAV